MNNNGTAMTEVKSSTIKAVGFQGDEETGTLVVEFSGGARYHYAKVPRSVFTDLVTAESVGKFFASKVKGQFDYQKEPFEKQGEAE